MFELKFETDNAAFANGAEAIETAAILREVARRILNGELDGKIRDFNGNTVGAYVLNGA